MKKLKVHKTALAGLKVVERQQSCDNRGSLSRLFCTNELKDAGWLKIVAQVNHVITLRKGTVRGLHFQHPPHAEIKLVSCLRGAVWDVAVDLRVGSPTIFKWHAEILSEVNCRAMLIPEGFAHGYQAMSDDCELIYLHSEEYAPDAEAGLNARDPTLSIQWPLSIVEISARDQQHPLLGQCFEGVVL